MRGNPLQRTLYRKKPKKPETYDQRRNRLMEMYGFTEEEMREFEEESENDKAYL